MKRASRKETRAQHGHAPHILSYGAVALLMSSYMEELISHVTAIPKQILDVHREQEQHTPRQQHTAETAQTRRHRTAETTENAHKTHRQQPIDAPKTPPSPKTCKALKPFLAFPLSTRRIESAPKVHSSLRRRQQHRSALHSSHSAPNTR